jgi:hypothetical protein
MNHINNLFFAVAYCRKQSDADDSDDEEVVKRPKSVCVSSSSMFSLGICTHSYADFVDSLSIFSTAYMFPFLKWY